MLVTDFKPINSVQRAKDRVTAMRQKRSATEYCDDFRLTVLDIPDMDEAWKLDSFLRGLKPNVQREHKRYPPANLHEAMRQAERIDAVDFKYSNAISSTSTAATDGSFSSGTAMPPGTASPRRWSLAASTSSSD